MEVVLLVVVAGGVQLGLRLRRRWREHHRVPLEQIAAHLGGRADGSAAAGARFGAAVTFRFVRRRPPDAGAWTEIDVVVPDAYPLAIHIRRDRWLDKLDEMPGDRADTVDLQLGDPAFDRRYTVEAAPEDVARVLLGPDLRRLLLAQDKAELETRTEGAGKVLRFATRGWIGDLDAATSAIDVIASVASRVGEAYDAVDATASRRLAGAPYRPAIDAPLARDVAAARDAELDALEARRLRRARRARLWTAIIFAFLIASFLAKRLLGSNG